MQKKSSIQNTSDSLQQSRSLEENKQASFFTPVIQPRLSINQPNDIYEQEADAMAEQQPDVRAEQPPGTKPAEQSGEQRSE